MYDKWPSLLQPCSTNYHHQNALISKFYINGIIQCVPLCLTFQLVVFVVSSVDNSLSILFLCAIFHSTNTSSLFVLLRVLQIQLA